MKTAFPPATVPAPTRSAPAARPRLATRARRTPLLTRALCFITQLVALVLSHLAPAQAASATAWPELTHPQDAVVEPVDGEILLNGVPMRLTRVRVAAPPGTVAGHYRRALGGGSVVAQAGTHRVLSQARGDFLITVTLTSLADGGSEALVSIADARAARGAGSRRLGFALPAGSELLSDMQSIDGRIASRQLVLANTHSLEGNLRHLAASLSRLGLQPEGPALADTADTHAQAFRGPGGEARLVLVRRDGTTSAVLTVLSPRP